MSTQRAPVPAMKLLFACCRWPSETGSVVRLADGVDGAVFLALARRHRVEGLAYRALSRAGVTLAGGEALAADARRIAVDNLRLAAEATRLHRLLVAADVPVVVLKGVALGMLAYGDLGVKMGWDIDLLVAPDRLDVAAGVLTAAGYRNILPGPGSVALDEWHRFAKDSAWRHQESGAHVELHTGLLANPALLAGIDARTRAQIVALSPGLAIPTLAPDSLFAYLCLHGAASGWRRLKWLADLAALLARGDAAATERLYERSQQLGAGRAAGQALLLCRRYFDTPLPPRLSAILARDRTARLLARMAARMMTDPRGYDDPAERFGGTLPIHLAQFMLLPGWRHRWGEMRLRFRPDPRIGGSPLIYPVRVLYRRWRAARSADR